MGNTQNCVDKSKFIYTEFFHSLRVKLLEIEVNPHPGSYTFLVTFNRKIQNADGDIIKGISISIPPDLMGNRGPEEPYNEPTIPRTIETALIGIYNDVMHEEIERFCDISDVITHLEKFADGALLKKN